MGGVAAPVLARPDPHAGARRAFAPGERDALCRHRGRLFSRIDEGDAHSWSPGSAGDASFSPPWMRDEGGRDVDGCCATARFWACDSCRASTPTKAWTSGRPIDDVGSWRLAWT